MSDEQSINQNAKRKAVMLLQALKESSKLKKEEELRKKNSLMNREIISKYRCKM